MKRLPFVLIALLSFVCSAHNATQNPKTTVGVTVEGGDSMAAQVDMVIRSRLRQLGDVRVQDQNPDYKMEITLVPVIIGNTPKGYAMGIAIFAPYNPARFRALLGDGLDPKTLDAVDERLRGTSFHIKSGIESGSTRDVDDMCASAVATVDRYAIEPMRQKLRR